jgi:hypothetical protein
MVSNLDHLACACTIVQYNNREKPAGLAGPGGFSLIEGKEGPREETDKVSFRALVHLIG